MAAALLLAVKGAARWVRNKNQIDSPASPGLTPPRGKRVLCLGGSGASVTRLNISFGF